LDTLLNDLVQISNKMGYHKSVTVQQAILTIARISAEIKLPGRMPSFGM
jgi:hypothetical protein